MIFAFLKGFRSLSTYSRASIDQPRVVEDPNQTSQTDLGLCHPTIWCNVNFQAVSTSNSWNSKKDFLSICLC